VHVSIVIVAAVH